MLVHARSIRRIFNARVDFGRCFKWLAVHSRILPTDFNTQPAMGQRFDLAARSFRAA